MPDRPSLSPLNRVADAVPEQAVERFESVSNTIRLAILLALWEAYDPYEPTNSVTFSELREQTGVTDSGRFNYHLNNLDPFVEQTAEGYRLSTAGLRIVQMILAGTGFETSYISPTSVDENCPFCGSSVLVTVQDGRLYVLCADCAGTWGKEIGGVSFEGVEDVGGIFMTHKIDPAGLEDSSPRDLYEAAIINNYFTVQKADAGICSVCSGTIERRLDICERHDGDRSGPCSSCGRTYRIRMLTSCTTCKDPVGYPPALGLTTHPSVRAFLDEHVIEDATSPLPTRIDRTLNLAYQATTEVDTRDPLRVRVTYTEGPHTLSIVFDESQSVVEVVD